MLSVSENISSSTHHQLLLPPLSPDKKQSKKDNQKKKKKKAFHFENIYGKADYIYGYQDFRMK